MQLLKIAVEKLRRGYVAINSEQNQAFWQDYRQKITTELPFISMKPVSVVPVNSDWIDLKLGSQKMAHKLAKGYLDFSKPSTEFEATLVERFGDKIEYLNFKSGDTIRVHTNPLDRLTPLSEQESSYRQVLDDLRLLANTSVLDSLL